MKLFLPFTLLKILSFIAGIMAIPPSYADLGKSAKDIFNKGYGNWKQYIKAVLYVGFGLPTEDRPDAGNAFINHRD